MTPHEDRVTALRGGRAGLGEGAGGAALSVAPGTARRLRDTVDTFSDSCLSWNPQNTPTPEMGVSLQVGSGAWMAPVYKQCFETMSLPEVPGLSHPMASHVASGRGPRAVRAAEGASSSRGAGTAAGLLCGLHGPRSEARGGGDDG